MFGNPKDESQRMQKFWMETHSKLGISKPSNLNYLHSSYFQHDNFLVWSFSLPISEVLGECYSGCRVIGSIAKSVRVLPSGQAADIVNAAPWNFSLLQFCEPQSRLLHSSNENMNVTALSDLDFIGEREFASFMLECFMNP